jgi:hypothetical protein
VLSQHTVVIDVDGGDSEDDEHRADDASSLVARNGDGTARGVVAVARGVNQVRGAVVVAMSRSSPLRCGPGSGFLVIQLYCARRARRHVTTGGISARPL